MSICSAKGGQMSGELEDICSEARSLTTGESTSQTMSSGMGLMVFTGSMLPALSLSITPMVI